MSKQSIDETLIRETAYFIWLDAGQPAGCEQAHWDKAIDALTPAKPKAKKAATRSPAKTAKAKTAASKAEAPRKTAKKPAASKANAAAKSALAATATA